MCQDPIMPPFGNLPGRDDKSMDTAMGYFYSSARNVTRSWAIAAGCGGEATATEPPEGGGYDTAGAPKMRCQEQCDGRIVECLWPACDHKEIVAAPLVTWSFFRGGA